MPRAPHAAHVRAEVGHTVHRLHERRVHDLLVRVADPDLRQRLNAALKSIVDDGTYAKINAKYFPFSIY